MTQGIYYATAAAKSLQSCPTLCDPTDGSHQVPLSLVFSRQEHWNGWPFPSPVHARMLSRFSRVRLCASLWTAAHQAPLSTGFSRQEYWRGLPCPPPGDLPNPGIEPMSLMAPVCQASSLPLVPAGTPYTCICSLLVFSSVTAYHRIFNIILCTIQVDLVYPSCV